MSSNNAPLLEVSSILERLTIVESEAQEAELIQSIASTSKTVVVSFLNQYAFNLAFSLGNFRTALIRSDYVFRDGVGIELCLSLLQQRAGLNENGTDFIPRLLAALAGKRVAVFGTNGEWLKRAVAAMKAKNIAVVSSLDGFQPLPRYMAEVTAQDPDVILIGMGMPKQEIVAAWLAEISGRPRVIINGGAILDFYGQRFPRAPHAIRRMRLEWLYRFYREPRRLARRYLIGGFVFAWHLFEIWQLRRGKTGVVPANTAIPKHAPRLPERRASSK